MNAFAVGLAATLVGVGAHMILLRHLAPARRLPALPLLLVIALGALCALRPSFDGPFQLADGVVALVLALSFGFAYALVLNGVLYDSPTLALVNAIEAEGAAGMPVAAFDRFVARHPFIASRLGALIAAGELSVQGDQLVLAGKVVHLLTLGDAYRRLRGGAPSEAG
jgi:hypothetical protein